MFGWVSLRFGQLLYASTLNDRHVEAGEQSLNS